MFSLQISILDIKPDQLHDGEHWFVSCISAKPFCLYGKVSVSETAKMRDGLSKREGEVLSWLQQGMSNKEIAIALEVSPRTVQKHLQRIYLHLDVPTRAEAIVRMRRGLRDIQ
ncbi:MAG TPA: helix-turn-helix transcriptional regulator [Nitrospiraceae bacterium]|nr:helix-turn-helix transcriptional regulator [Nitrospiraceae bacterium]